MKKLLIILILNTFGHYCTMSQVVDRSPSGGENTLPVEGGSIKVEIDVTTSLDNLLSRLNGDWQFIETGKSYWIGYTNDMFSIAARGDAAIPALVKFFNTKSNENGKIGAIYTLHLIGINRQIKGRYYEEFVNQKARNALLGLLQEREYSYTIMELLLRDPWLSDINQLFNVIINEQDDKILYPIICSLNKYKIGNFPLDNEIPEQITKIGIKLKVENPEKFETEFDFSGQIKDALRKFSNLHPENIKVDSTLYNDELNGYINTILPRDVDLESFVFLLGIKGDLYSYVNICCKIQYYCKDNVIYFISIKKAQTILQHWWNSLSYEEKKKFLIK